MITERFFGTQLWATWNVDDAIEDLNTRYNEALEADIAAGSTTRLVISDYDPLHPNEGTIEYLSE